MDKLSMLRGVSAAVLTPRTPDGNLDLRALTHQLEFLMQRGIKSFALNGATGEFPLTTPEEFQALLSITAAATAGRAHFIAGIGAHGHLRAIELGAIATASGAQAVLLPMPFFYPHTQDDLKAFTTTVAASVELPILLYNLPQFTTGLAPQTTLELIDSCANIIGIKDSSGSLETLSLLTSSGIQCTRIIGNDAVISDAIQEHICDGAISGIACALPEFIQQLYAAPTHLEMRSTLATLLDQLQTLPTPWGLKIISEARGITTAIFSQPLSISRAKQMDQLRQWFSQNRKELGVFD